MSQEALTPAIPNHVPEELYWDHSIAEYTHELDDPFVAAGRLHDGPDILYGRDVGQGRPGWLITRFDKVKEAFIDYEHFTSKDGSGLSQVLDVDWRLIPLDYDPPEHTVYRHILNPFFTPGEVNVLETAVREVCDSLMAKFEDRGSCEFIEEFAIPFPSYIFLSLVGMPIESAPQFLKWEEKLLRGQTIEERVIAARSICSYLEGFVKEQRANPTTELLKGIVEARIYDGRPLTDGEIIGMLYTFYLGGLDTVYSTLGFIFNHLTRDQELQQKLRGQPDLIPNAVHELARAYSVVGTMRKVAKDFEFHGVKMCKGDTVLLPLYLAARDPKHYKNPHEIDLNRQSGRLTFASGPHICLGAHLARREIKIVLETFLSKFNNIRIPDGEKYEYHTGVVFGVDRLPLTWDKL